MESPPGLDRLGWSIVVAEPGRGLEVRRELDRAPGVLHVEPDVGVRYAAVTPNDTHWDRQWAARRIGAPEAWRVTTGSAWIVVAVLDTGVDAKHPDLEGAVLQGRNVVDGGTDTQDRHGHGTAAAGIIAARTNNGIGVASVCWTCSILPVKVLSDQGIGLSSDVAEGIIWAADNGAHVINLSLGGPVGTLAVEQAVDYARDRGVLVVASAGNESSTDRFFPAAYDGAVGVSATTDSDTRYSWSNYGSWVDLAAPGCNESTFAGGSYDTFCGTSSAGPVVAGVAALALAANGGLHADDLVATLRTASTSVGSIVRYGRVDALETVLAVVPERCRLGVPVTGDWDGNGRRNIGCFRDGTWTLRLSNGSLRSFTYGVQAGDVPVTGDWNRDGRDGVGIFRRGGEWHLRNSLSGSGGRTAYRFTYGRQQGDVPVSGDWNGDGGDGPGIFRNGEWHIRNAFSGSTDEVTGF